jgi:hypothetical protein
MFFLVDKNTQEVIARFESKTHGMTAGQLMAKDGARALELRAPRGGEAVALFTATGEVVYLDN